MTVTDTVKAVTNATAAIVAVLNSLMVIFVPTAPIPIETEPVVCDDDDDDDYSPVPDLIYGPMELCDILLLTPEKAEDIIKNLKECKCCERHQQKKPGCFESYNPRDYKTPDPELDLHECECEYECECESESKCESKCECACRFNARWICKCYGVIKDNDPKLFQDMILIMSDDKREELLKHLLKVAKEN